MLEFTVLYLLDFASVEECEHLRRLIDLYVEPHALAPKDVVTHSASVALLNQLNDPTVQSLDARFAKAIGVAPELSEGVQGQRYEVGDYYAEHYDAFEPSYPDCARHLEARGQRTYTATLYLNTLAEGGELIFPALGVYVRPRLGLAVAWYNLTPGNEPNPLSAHSAAAPAYARKYITSLWFRERRAPLE
jgi:prolyl 4-hydroxylase